MNCKDECVMASYQKEKDVGRMRAHIAVKKTDDLHYVWSGQ